VEENKVLDENTSVVSDEVRFEENLMIFKNIPKHVPSIRLKRREL